MNENIDWHASPYSADIERVRMGVKASNRILTCGELKKIWDSLSPTSLSTSQRKIWEKHVEEFMRSYESMVCSICNINPSELNDKTTEVQYSFTFDKLRLALL